MNIKEILRRYFDLRADKVDEEQTIANIRADASFRGAQLWVLIFAIFIASLGLNVNSTAVIIGAMLISPLMGPIVGMGLAVGINDLDLLRVSAKNFAVATLFSVATATVYFLLSPYRELQSELLARTSPTLYDVLIAFFGGAAGIVAIATGGKGNVIPGVAIATALMPPLCTAGYGLATGQWVYFLGAFYLFFINTVFIAGATFLGVRLMQFKVHQEVNKERAVRARRMFMFLVVLTLVPAGFMTFSLVRRSLFEQRLASFTEAELSWPGTQILSRSADRDACTISVAVIGREVEAEQIETARERLSEYGLADYELNVVQGTQSDSLTHLLGELQHSKTDLTRTTLQQNQQIRTLEVALDDYQRLNRLAEQLRPELRALYPDVAAISLARTTEVLTDTAAADGGTPLTMAVVTLADGKRLDAEQGRRLEEWLEARVEADTLALVVR
jgi:uncharacterized hydrophobic protein (TIGR00271 family)